MVVDSISQSLRDLSTTSERLTGTGGNSIIDSVSGGVGKVGSGVLERCKDSRCMAGIGDGGDRSKYPNGVAAAPAGVSSVAQSVGGYPMSPGPQQLAAPRMVTPAAETSKPAAAPAAAGTAGSPGITVGQGDLESRIKKALNLESGDELPPGVKAAFEKYGDKKDVAFYKALGLELRKKEVQEALESSSKPTPAQATAQPAAKAAAPVAAGSGEAGASVGPTTAGIAEANKRTEEQIDRELAFSGSAAPMDELLNVPVHPLPDTSS